MSNNGQDAPVTLLVQIGDGDAYCILREGDEVVVHGSLKTPLAPLEVFANAVFDWTRGALYDSELDFGNLTLVKIEGVSVAGPDAPTIVTELFDLLSQRLNVEQIDIPIEG